MEIGMLVWMDKHNIAKNVLFSEIGLSVGIYESIGKVKKDILNRKTTSGTHLFNSIEDGWAEVAINNNSSNKLDLNSMLSRTREDKLILNKLSTSIARRFFCDAYNEKLESIVYEGVTKASFSLSRNGHVSNDA
jgi:hypothetical protein